MLGPDPVNEGTMSSNMGPSMQIGSAFIQRPRDQFGISQWEKVGEQQGVDKTIPRVGVDNAEKPAYTMDDLLRQARLEGVEDGDEIPTKLQKKLRKKSPAYARPGEFNSANGGTAPGKKQKIKVEEKTRKQRSAENKARFAKLSPEEKAKTKGDAPFHPEVKESIGFDKKRGFFVKG